MKNYFYDMLPNDLQQYIITIANDENRKDVVRKVYIPWSVRVHDWVFSIEEYRHQLCLGGKLWYMDMLIRQGECGGTSMLKTSRETSSEIFNNHTIVYDCCDMVDEIRFRKTCDCYTQLQRKTNKRLWDEDCDVYVGNVWSKGYVSPLSKHEDISNDSYDEGYFM